MEITKTFTNALPFVIRAKMRGFFRRSVYRYIFAAWLVTYAFSFQSLKSVVSIEFLKVWSFYSVVICGLAIIIILISAAIQSRRLDPRQITFREDAITITDASAVKTNTWGWVIHAEELDDCFALLIQKSPRHELFISKKSLGEGEYKQLRAWLAKHDKLEM